MNIPMLAAMGLPREDYGHVLSLEEAQQLPRIISGNGSIILREESLPLLFTQW
jgi:hypothetical protein